MAFVKIGSLAALPPGSVMEAEVGEGTYAICNVGGQLSALDGICPHAGGPLGKAISMAKRWFAPGMNGRTIAARG